MEIIASVVLFALMCPLFYKMFSVTVKIFLWITLIGAALSGITMLFSGGVNFDEYSINGEQITSEMCDQPNNECISKIIKEGHLALVIVQSPVCILCKVNKIISLTTSSFTDLALNHNIEVIYITPDMVNRKYPEILIYADKHRLPLNVVFSRSSPFGRPLNGLLTKSYLMEQLEEEIGMCELLTKNSKGKHKHSDDNEVQDILTTLKEREKIDLAVRSSVI